jgi:serine phosphatase RsbU (regulator of sigma subunit)
MKMFGSYSRQIETPAFERAQLRSEVLRVTVVIAAVVALLLLQGVRMIALHAKEDRAHLAVQSGLVLLLVLYELFVLHRTKRALEGRSALSRFVWLSPIVLESAIPAMGIAMLTSAVIASPYRPLANPVILTFFFFIILSILRLSPPASLLSGFMAAGSFLCASYYLGWRPQPHSHSSIQSPERAVVTYALLLVLAGVIAGTVAREVEKYVTAALREAETKRRVERLQHDMNVARSIQQSLLPRNVPTIKGFELAGWNLPAEETGGDFYDWQVFPNGKTVLILADVSGHGLGPAMLAAVCRAYARASLSIQDGLLTAMGRINAALVDDLTPGRFATLVAAVCSPDSSRVELLSAGHGPLFVYVFREDRMESMGAQALPLGIAPALSADPPRDLNLSEGDLLVLVTDGLCEWENAAGQQFGAERLEQVVRHVRQKNPKEIIDELYKAALEFSGGTEQQDDVTAIILKRTA